MPRGGYREKAGRPSTWKSGCKFSETKLIRVPSAIANEVLKAAHRLDAGESLESVTKSESTVQKAPESILAIVKRWVEKGKTISPSTGKWTAARKLLAELEVALEAEQTSLKI